MKKESPSNITNLIRISLTSCIFALTLLLFYLIYLTSNGNNYYKGDTLQLSLEDDNNTNNISKQNLTVKKIVDFCDNRTLRESAYCVRDYISIIYKYKVTPDNETLTFEELKINGGDCRNWNELWVFIMNEYEFDIRQIIIDVDEISAHIFSIFSDESGYCLVDQRSVQCYGYE